MINMKDKIPQIGKDLVKYKGIDLIDKLGHDVILSVVESILCGGNVRAMTEKLTQRRIAMSNSSMLMTFIELSYSGIHLDELYETIQIELLTNKKLTISEKNFLLWMIGLTGKSIQNVLRGDKKNLIEYINGLTESLNNNERTVLEDFGLLKGDFAIGDKSLPINWKTFLQLSLAIGTQTLAIRGAEKSMYGKFFEKLILGCLLSILGFKFIKNTDTSSSENVFWLSERGDKRESDATLLLKPGKGIRFDIGFIGVGNTEISLDKVSRFEREMERGSEKHFMKTIILIDRIGDKSRILEMAKAIDGSIVQMSMNYWVYEVANLLSESLGFKHEILKLSKEESIQFINANLKTIKLKSFIEGIYEEDFGNHDEL